MPITPGGIPLVDAAVCFHCQSELEGSPFGVSLHTSTEDITLPLCRSCQGLRQEGQLPVELLLQQWVYASGQRDDTGTVFEHLYVSLACLGCGSPLAALSVVNPGAAPLVLAASRRLPDGSTVVACPHCQRTNVLEGRGGQLVAVRLW
jgi:ribosomal protein S27E